MKAAAAAATTFLNKRGETKGARSQMKHIHKVMESILRREREELQKLDAARAAARERARKAREKKRERKREK